MKSFLKLYCLVQSFALAGLFIVLSLSFMFLNVSFEQPLSNMWLVCVPISALFYFLYKIID